MPKKTLTNIQKLAVQALLLENVEAAEIAKEVEADQKVVEAYIEETRGKLESIRKNISKKETKKRAVKNDGYVKRGHGGSKGVLVATQTSSERGDRAAERTGGNSDKMGDHIHIIDPEKENERIREYEAQKKKRQEEARRGPFPNG